ncbi:hypothetical protein [Streptomyces syringium]|uniref:hypothetical protein n=1 Tax=Streptomyces syringium TaxID=76729 RepID=UPI0033DD15FD
MYAEEIPGTPVDPEGYISICASKEEFEMLAEVMRSALDNGNLTSARWGVIDEFLSEYDNVKREGVRV